MVHRIGFTDTSCHTSMDSSELCLSIIFSNFFVKLYIRNASLIVCTPNAKFFPDPYHHLLPMQCEITHFNHAAFFQILLPQAEKGEICGIAGNKLLKIPPSNYLSYFWSLLCSTIIWIHAC